MDNTLLIEVTRVPVNNWLQIIVIIAIVILGMTATLFTLAVCGLLDAIVVMVIAVITLYFTYTHPFTIPSERSVPLSQISDQVHVTNSKVVIDKLPDNIKYRPERLKDSRDRKIFVFSYDETFETGKLTDATGEIYPVSDADTQFLKERGAKNG